jgi:hypothetical protein
MSMQSPEVGRPTGVTILAVLAAISGVISLFGGLGIAGLGYLAAGGGVVSGFTTMLWIVLLVLGLIELVLAYGFWSLRPWAWSLGIGVQGAGVVINVLQFVNNGAALTSTVVSVLVAAAIIYYLLQPHVRAAFGRT